MNDIDIKPLHPKHKLLLYSRYVLSKLSWHFTIHVANISKTWITEHLDSVVNGYIRKWLDIPISGTLSNVFLERNKFGLSICPPSIKFTQCQTVLRNSLKESPNDSLKDRWKSSSCHTNIQYDYPASRGFSLVFLSVVLPSSSRFWLLAFRFGCFCAEEKTSADSRLRFLLSMREMKMRLPWNFWVTCR